MWLWLPAARSCLRPITRSGRWSERERLPEGETISQQQIAATSLIIRKQRPTTMILLRAVSLLSLSLFLSLLLSPLPSNADGLGAHPDPEGGERFVIIDQDCSGPGTTNTNSVLAVLRAQRAMGVRVLGITVSSGDGWLAEEVCTMSRVLSAADTVQCHVCSRQPTLYNVMCALGSRHLPPASLFVVEI